MTVTPLPSGPHEDLADLARRGLTWPPIPGDHGGLRPAAVLVLFGALDTVPAHHACAVPADLDVLLVARSGDLTHHPGQIAFPGGRLDPEDDGPVAGALREAREETGLDPAGVEVLGTLAALPLPVSRHLVTPVLGWWRVPSAVGVVDHRESSAVFRAPVADLVDPARRAVVRSLRPPTFRTPAFELDGHLVWGFTAIVLDTLLEALGWAEPWDRGRELALPV